MPTPLKPGETPQRIAAQVLRDVMEAERRGDNMDPIITAALQSYGDRRGEEERAKALERAATVCDALSASERGNNYGNLGNAFEECAALIRSLAAAPSGDAKGTK